jgi:Mce-associated membrane protein
VSDDQTPPEPDAPARRQGAAAAARRASRIGGLGVPAAREDAPGRVGEPQRAATTSGTLPDGSPDTASPDTASPDTAGAVVAPGVEPAPARVVAVPDWLRWLPAAVVSAAAIAMAVLLVVFSHGVWWAKPSSASVRDRVLAAAKTCMTAINTYKYTELDAYERRALACTTGAFTGDLRQAIQSIVKVKAPQLKASQTISVHDVGIESVNGNHWTVLVFAQVDLKSITYPKGSQTPYAAEVDLEKVGGKWLLSRETTLGGTSSGGAGTGTSPSAGPSASAPAGSVSPSKPAGSSGK